MRVDRGGARLQPDARRAIRRAIASSDRARRGDARLENLAAIRLRVAAVDAAAGEVDHDVAAVDLAGPAGEVAPSHATSRHGRFRGARLNTTTRARRDERCGRGASHLSGAAGDDDAHGQSPANSLTGSSKVDESVLPFWARHQALLTAAEHAIPVACDDVVEAIEQAGRKDAEECRRLPRPSQRAEDEQCGAAPGERSCLGRPVVGDDVHGRHVVRIAAMASHHRSTLGLESDAKWKIPAGSRAGRTARATCRARSRRRTTGGGGLRVNRRLRDAADHG